MNQREIKFRVRQGKNWIYFGFPHGIIWRDSGVNWYTLSQYTGLKDKHGKEIWEGDIVSRSWEGIDGQEHFSYPQEVVWSGQGWNLKPQAGDNPSGALGGAYQKETEVIGNIYENENLLDITSE